MSKRFDGLTNATILENYSSADHQSIVIGAKMEFDTSTIRLHTGLGDLTINSETYDGAGSLLSISEVEDDSELASKGLSISLSGMDQTVLDYALTENYQNRPITLHMAFLQGNTDVAGEFILFKGRMTNMTISDSVSGAIITLSAENRLTDLERPSNLRYTSESQKFLFSGDKGMDFVASLQTAEFNWGPIQVGNISGGGSNGTIGRGRDVGHNDVE